MFIKKLNRFFFSFDKLMFDLLNPLTPGTFLRKVCFLDTLVIFRLDHGQITFNPVENACATQQLAFLATSIMFYHNVTWACAEIKIFSFWTGISDLCLQAFRFLDFFFFLFFTFFSFFSFLFCCSD